MHSARSDNLGVGALTVAEVEIIRDIARRTGVQTHITVLDWKDPRTPYVSGPDVTLFEMGGKDLIRPGGFWAQVRRADLVIDIGAGDSFADIYGPRRLNRMFVMKYLTHLARRPLVLAPQTIGPFTRPVSRLLARLSIRLCRIVATRDAKSTDALRELGIDTTAAKVIEASDVAFMLPFDLPAPRAAGAPLRVGLNVSGLLMNGGYTGKNMFALKSDYPMLVRKIIRLFLDRPERCEVHLVPHVITEKQAIEDDYSASQALAAEFPGIVVAPKFATPSEAKSYIAGMDFFMGARMHSCIAAFSSGVPVVPMAYSRKFAGLFGTLGYDATVDCTADDEVVILESITEAFANRDNLAGNMGQALDAGRQKLATYVGALEAEIRKAAGRRT
jgi:polysaccharide pyruvyl transferase WcaK-like protein